MVQNAVVVSCNRAAYFVTDDREFNIKSNKLFRRKRERGPFGVQFPFHKRVSNLKLKEDLFDF